MDAFLPFEGEVEVKVKEWLKDYEDMKFRIALIHAHLLNLKIPKWRWWFKKEELSLVKHDFISLVTKEFVEWHDKADSFYINPPYDIKDLSVQHFHEVVKRGIDSLTDSMDKVTSFYNFIIKAYRDNFINDVAVTGWIVSFAGMVFSIVSLLKF